MTDYNRYTDIHYLLHTSKLKCKAYQLKSKYGARPIDLLDFNQVDDAALSLASQISKYTSFDYFDYDQAKSYYRDSPHLISKIITALVYHNQFGTTEYFSEMVSSIQDKLTQQDDALVYLHEGGYPKFDMSPHCISGITQGKLASLFIRAEEYDEAKSCLEGCLLPSTQNGPFRRLSQNMIWIEEYPGKYLTMVLNGFVFALIGLSEYQIATGDTAFNDILAQGINALTHVLPHYWQSGELLYSMYHWDLCNIHYTGIMTYMWRHLNELIPSEIFTKEEAKTNGLCKWDIFERMLKS